MSKVRRIHKMGALIAAYYGGGLGRRQVSRKFLNHAARVLRVYYGSAAEQAVRRAIRGIRPYASFFEWPNKTIKELGAARTFVEALGDPLTFGELRPGGDPPDVVGVAQGGDVVAIEVTELVEESVVGHNVRAMKDTVGKEPIDRMKRIVLRDWDKPGLVAAIEERLRAKDVVTLKGGPFTKYIVLLHTDEPMLTHYDAEEWLLGHKFEGMRQVQDAYLLFSYDGQRYPCIRLTVSR